MHELSIVQNMVATADEYARKEDINVVKYLSIQVGGATGVIPKYLQMYYSEVCEGTRLEGSELKIEEIEAEAWCKNCGETFFPFQTRQVCPYCNHESYELIHGEELLIKEIGYI